MKKYIYLMIFFLPVFLNAQTSWTVMNSGTAQNLNSIDFYNEYNGLVAGDIGLILKTVDGGDTWESVTSGTSNNLNGISFVNADTAVVVGDGPTILRTIDGGENWTSITSGVYGNLISVDINVDGNGIIGGSDQTILRTNDTGATWTITQTGYMGGGWQGSQMVDGSLGFVFGSNSIFQPFLGKTTNSGTSFNFYNFYFVQGAVSHEGRLYDGHFFDASFGIAVGRRWDGLGCISSTSDLNNWTTLHYPTPFYGVCFSTETDGYVVGDDGTILHTIDGGGIWEYEDSGVFSQFNSVDFLSEGVGFIVGDEGVILKKDETGAGDYELPIADSQLSSYPNPFNPTTTISFSIQNNSEVELSIFNITGQKVRTLVNGQCLIGEHFVVWNGECDKGKSVSSGIYLYKLNVNGKAETVNKCLLLK